jgi:hypothetical protein
MPQPGPDNNFIIKFGAFAGALIAVLFFCLISSMAGPIEVPHYSERAAALTPAPAPTPTAMPLPPAVAQSSATDSADVSLVGVSAVLFIMAAGITVLVFLLLRPRDEEMVESPPQIVSRISDSAARENERRIQLERRHYFGLIDLHLAQKQAQREWFWRMLAAETKRHTNADKNTGADGADGNGSARGEPRRQTAHHPTIRNSQRSRPQPGSPDAAPVPARKQGKNNRAKSPANNKRQRS